MDITTFAMSVFVSVLISTSMIIWVKVSQKLLITKFFAEIKKIEEEYQKMIMGLLNEFVEMKQKKQIRVDGMLNELEIKIKELNL
jgi:hypothetical protein